ncbi:hypothetical protein OUZ56_026244 [Daphnia magna]|uniref:Uncharacterized protein n=1 Tax=Daphnia magna TaxID=35525 RepID=A0ABQ9ZLA0_9CRUS|nr:hypothetical protein OUZ56_026244 [Daphnia magna]
MVSQCIHIEYKSKECWYHSVFTLNTKVKTHEVNTNGITVYQHCIQKYKLMVSQCIHIEYKSKNSWYHNKYKLKIQDSFVFASFSVLSFFTLTSRDVSAIKIIERVIINTFIMKGKAELQAKSGR